MRLFCFCLVLIGFLPLGCEQRKPASTAPPPGAVVQQQPGQPAPPPSQPGQPQQQKPKSLGQSVRAAAYRPERQNELRQIGLFFRNYEIENNRNPRTEAEFIQYMQRDAPGIAKALSERYYIHNLRVNMKGGADGVIAYEDALDGPGHMAVRVDCSVSLITPADLKKALGGF